MGANESRPGSSDENSSSATLAFIARMAVEKRRYATTDKDLERNDVIVVDENGKERGRRAYSESGDVVKDVKERRYATKEKDLDTLYLGFNQSSVKERRNDAIVVAENGKEGGRRKDSGSGDVEKDAEVVVLDDVSKDGEERGEELVSKEGGRGEVTGSGDVDKGEKVIVRDEGRKDEEGRGDKMVRKEGSKEGSEKEKEVVLVEDVNEGKAVVWEEGSKEGSEKEKEVVQVENANKGKGVKGLEEEKGRWRVEMKENLEMPCYPQRPHAKDCTFYLHTGTCSYKHDCRFNHPPDKRNNKIVLENATNSKGEKKVPESVEKWTCKHYLSPAGCRSGSSCKFRHQPEGYSSKSIELNFMGLPIRPGEKTCSYYMRTGSCKFSTSCWYNHPEPTEIGGKDSFSDRLPSYTSQMPTTQSLLPHLEGNDYERPLNSSVPWENGDRHSSRPCLSEYQQSSQITEIPQELGQSTSSNYMKSGNFINTPCKADYPKNKVTDFSTYHRPRNRFLDSSACLLSPMGLPLRPGRSICRQYNLHGICKSGPTCRYDHPDLIFPD